MIRCEGVVGVCTRGMLMTEVMDGIIRNILPRIFRTGERWTVRSTWDKDIPDAQNEVTSLALRLDPMYIWFVEEDTVPPSGILDRMMIHIADADVVVADYKMPDGSSVLVKKGDKLERGGLGCTLVRADIFSKISHPYFEVGFYVRMADGSYVKQGCVPGYGTQDISFFVKLLDLGAKVVAVDGMRCKHLKLEEPGKLHTNKGVHKIREY